jgi:hypothetical protein
MCSIEKKSEGPEDVASCWLAINTKVIGMGMPSLCPIVLIQCSNLPFGE